MMVMVVEGQGQTDNISCVQFSSIFPFSRHFHPSFNTLFIVCHPYFFHSRIYYNLMTGNGTTSRRRRRRRKREKKKQTDVKKLNVLDTHKKNRFIIVALKALHSNFIRYGAFFKSNFLSSNRHFSIRSRRRNTEATRKCTENKKYPKENIKRQHFNICCFDSFFSFLPMAFCLFCAGIFSAWHSH